jgi:hypothetical protein
VRRSELAHILRSACDVTHDPEILVIGSQAILGSFDEDELPREVLVSIEADVAFLNDPEEHKSDAVDGAIGEDSRFHESFGIYGQGVSISTRHTPDGMARAIDLVSRSRGRREQGCLSRSPRSCPAKARGRPREGLPLRQCAARCRTNRRRNSVGTCATGTGARRDTTASPGLDWAASPGRGWAVR